MDQHPWPGHNTTNNMEWHKRDSIRTTFGTKPEKKYVGRKVTPSIAARLRIRSGSGW